ncbi:DUF7696 family protein [Bosea sp. NPDC055594]
MSYPQDPPLAYSYLAGREVSTWSEESKRECEIAYLAGLAPPKLSVMLDGVAGSTDREERGIKGVRGEAAVLALRDEIAPVQTVEDNSLKRKRPSPQRRVEVTAPSPL